MSNRKSRHAIWIAVAAGAVVSVLLGWLTSWENFFLAYLAAVLLPWSLSVGSLAWLLTISLTGGRWGIAIWPALVTHARLMPLVALLFVPWAIGIDQVYPWSADDYFTRFENTSHRQWFYQTPFFLLRTVGYFALWSVLAWAVRRGGSGGGESGNQDDGFATVRGGSLVAGIGLVATVLSVTWACIDWIMSIDPFFASTLFGIWIGSGAMLAALAASIATRCFAVKVEKPETVLGDLSGMLLAMLMLWAYFSWSQFLIMWSGDLPIEAQYYLVRSRGLWAIITPAVALLGFAVPFLCLLSYRFKRTAKWVGVLAISLIVVRGVELCWIVLPAADGQSSLLRLGMTVPLAATLLAIYGLLFSAAFKRSPNRRRDDVSPEQEIGS
ncbi:hypothetical protein FYK55_16475 [Roseiconus nitratireducens]|uniref:Quinol:cytochrome c oxidoreductase quinone-binding subunit 2 n=1 Tax=Roseiconus nitratireducens TaxID=2605748 RepID=A0A5M6D9D2_9BACT|nr:hypothetical protein [Roseiconus nitratireducens]KAA5541805.1 hypothetical protein FYK55_16475 [Roseiconus nitratireducens]